MTSLVKDEQRVREFWSFFLDFEIVDPSQAISQRSLLGSTDDEEDLKGIFFGPIFELRAFSDIDPVLMSIFYLLLLEQYY